VVMNNNHKCLHKRLAQKLSPKMEKLPGPLTLSLTVKVIYDLAFLKEDCSKMF
jgi:hypothetical protein